MLPNLLRLATLYKQTNNNSNKNQKSPPNSMFDGFFFGGVLENINFPICF